MFLTLKLDPATVELEKGFSRDVTSIGHWGTGDLEVVLRKLADLQLPPKAIGIAMLLVLLSLNLTRNGYAANSDLLTGRVAEYDRVMLKREAEVRAAEKDSSVRVNFTRLVDPPRTLPSYEVLGPLHGWMMDCEARFFEADPDQLGMGPGEAVQ